MNRELSAEDRMVLERSLTRLAGRLDGAVDFWPLVCLGRIGSDPRGFLCHHGEAIKSLVVVTEDLLAGTTEGGSEAVGDLLAHIVADVRKLQDGFLALEQFHSLPLEEVRSATVALADAYNDLRHAISQLGDALGVVVSRWQGRSSDVEAYYQGILHRLFELFRHERANRPAEVASRS